MQVNVSSKEVSSISLNLYFGFIGKQANTPVRILAILLLPTQKPPSRACELLLT